MSDILTKLISAVIGGIASGMPLFVIGSGLTLIFGVMRVLNFAHGALFMMGVYVCYTLSSGKELGFGGFILIIIAAAVVLGVVGGVVDIGVLRQLGQSGDSELRGMFAMYGVFLILSGSVAYIWGSQPLSVATPRFLSGYFTLMSGIAVTRQDLFYLVSGVLVAGGLFWLLRRTAFGRRVRAVAADHEMAVALGIRASRVRLEVFVLGAALAGFAGALSANLLSVNSSLATDYVLQAFAVVIAGGLGSVEGALVAALALGILESIVAIFIPQFSPYVLYAFIAVTAILTPRGVLRRGAVA
jgi:branched-chain amino acid transport system permease protein